MDVQVRLRIAFFLDDVGSLIARERHLYHDSSVTFVYLAVLRLLIPSLYLYRISIFRLLRRCIRCARLSYASTRTSPRQKYLVVESLYAL
jgi:hypothetical protein